MNLLFVLQYYTQILSIFRPVGADNLRCSRYTSTYYPGTP
jgi:hypothetical protein